MKRAVRATIRLCATGLLAVGALELELELARHHAHPGSFSVWRCLVVAVLVVLGVFLLITSRRLSEWLADDFEE